MRSPKRAVERCRFDGLQALALLRPPLNANSAIAARPARAGCGPRGRAGRGR